MTGSLSYLCVRFDVVSDVVDNVVVDIVAVFLNLVGTYFVDTFCKLCDAFCRQHVQ